MLKSKIFSRKTKADQLLPRDILKYSRMLSGEEVERHISNTIGKSGEGSITGSSSTINLMNGDTVTLGGALVLNATQGTVITNWEQCRNHLSNTTETVVTYLTYG